MLPAVKIKIDAGTAWFEVQTAVIGESDMPV